MYCEARLFTAIRAAPAGERGFTLIEILIAMALMSIGVAATIGVFGSSEPRHRPRAAQRGRASRRRPRSTG